jgi:SHS2 domain-containing protein
VTAGFEILEHTADVGVRAWGTTLAEAFEQAGWGVAEIAGIRRRELPGAVQNRQVRASGSDPGSTLVEFLNELVLLHETEGVALTGLRVDQVTETGVTAEAEVIPLDAEPDGTAIKAATYHQLRVDDRPDGAEVRVYFDV